MEINGQESSGVEPSAPLDTSETPAITGVLDELQELVEVRTLKDELTSSIDLATKSGNKWALLLLLEIPSIVTTLVEFPTKLWSAIARTVFITIRSLIRIFNKH